ncbi:thioester-containing protein 1 allele R1-like [Cochliomyia hominivorax]
MQLNLLLILVAAHLGAKVMCRSYYTILAPGTIKSHRKYSTSVTLHAADGPATIRLGILRTPKLLMFQDVTLEPYQNKVVDFHLPELSGQYELIAEGIEGLHFKNSSRLLVDDVKPLRVYMQTSKGVYKPGDLVKFRVFILDINLRPITLKEPVKVQIMDGHNHRVKQFKDITLNKGMFSESIQLSEQTNLGKWKIIVSISGKYNMREIKLFKVDQYILPKFSVHMDTVDHFVHEDEILKVTVYGKYVYGRYVEGKVTVKIMIENHIFEMLTKDIENHKANFEFNVTKYFHAAEVEPDFDVLAILNEKYTNSSQEVKKNIKHHNQRYKIEIPLEEIEFHNNKPYLIKAKVTYLSNKTGVNDQTTPIFMKHGSRVYKALLDQDGMATFTFNSSIDHNYIFYYKKTSNHLQNIFYNGLLSEDTLCNLKLKSGKIHLDKIVEVVLSSKSYIPYFVYTVMSRGNIFYSEYVKMEPEQNSYIIRIKPNIDLLPRTQMGVHYIDKGQLNYCDLVIGFPNEFENKINITTSNKTVEPGAEVTFQIQAQPQSRVGLLAIDLSAHLFNSDYALKKMSIIRQLFEDMAHIYPDNVLFGNLIGLLAFTNADVIISTPTTNSGIITKSRPSLRSAKKSTESALLRTKFPETWIFQEIDILEENTIMKINIPDTITTWLVTAISINENSGFGMMDQSLNITVFRSVFINLNLPYSIKRGEIVTIPVTVFNYNDKNLSCKITMNNPESDFRFLDEENNKLYLNQSSRYLDVTADSGTNAIFKIQALKLGTININVTASKNSSILDAIVQQLKVEPEGILINDNQEVFLNLQEEGVTKNSHLEALIPSDIVKESEFLRLSVGGDSMVPSVENLNNLVLLPTGCGEQNMINFVPNILVLDYLKVLNQWESHKDLIEKALGFIETGYQRELTYRHNSGGYSVFGPRFLEESTWLTAYVIRFFIKAVKYVAIEPEIITTGLDFLAYYQLDNGEFQLKGHLFYQAHKNRYGFTAFVLMAFMENKTYRKKYSHVIENALEFLSQNLDNINDTYALSLMAITFKMAESAKLSDIKNKLLARQKQEVNRKWWTSSDIKQSNDVEITAYALMALMDTEGLDTTSIFRWLIEQRKDNGGFGNTQETAVGLQALIKFSERSHILQDTFINITYIARNVQGLEVKKGVFEVTPDNYMILQKQELPRTTRSIQYEASGQGNSLLQFSYQYYVKENLHNSYTPATNVTLPTPLQTLSNTNHSDIPQVRRISKRLRSIMAPQKQFVITPLAKMNSEYEMLMEICFKYEPSKDLQLPKTNMIILDICLPSGFVSNQRILDEVLEEEIVTKVELQNSNSKIIIYFDQLQANDEHCLQVRAEKVHDIEMLKPSTIEMYDYYNENLRTTVFYDIKI